MSEEKGPDPNQPVTFGQLQIVLENISSTFNDALTKRDQQTEARFNQFASVLQQVVDKVNAGPEKPGSAIDKSEIVNKVADKLLSKIMGDEDDPNNDEDYQQYKRNQHELNKLVIKRANQALDTVIKKELKGNRSATAGMATKMIQADMASHEPI